MLKDSGTAIGEFGLIRWIGEQVGETRALVQGIGDDCAIQTPQGGKDLLISTDLLIEDVHFRRAWTSMFDLGRKSVAVNLSDIAAMGGTPQSLYLGLGRSAALGDDDIKDFFRGFLTEARNYDVVLAGGDTCASRGPLIIAVTAQGAILRGAAIRRKGATVGDLIYVSGTLGDSALALQLLQAGDRPATSLAARLHTPTARIGLGEMLSQQRLATAMLDVSDGLLADLQHLLDAAGVGADLELAALPLSDAFRDRLRVDPTVIDLALAGGEDYELLFTSSQKDLAERPDLLPGVVPIGRIVAQPGIRIRQRDGSAYQCLRRGFDHFVEG